MSVTYPPVAFHFSVSFDLPGVQDNDFRFREVSGLTMELDEYTHAEGGENRYVHKLPGRAKYPDLTLKRGLVTSSVVTDWCREAVQNLDIVPTTVWVSLLDETHAPLMTYVFEHAWPKKWVVADLNAESSSVAIESLDLAYRKFSVE